LTFWQKLTSKLGDNLYDEVIVNFLLGWFKDLVKLKERPIRHTTSFTAFIFGQTLLEILTEFQSSIKEYEGKIAIEKKKKNKLRSKITELEV